ncbi:MAG: DEAD/DEAH box helicase family protein [Motiliproteus sp.]|nr:DEAD/DEAH box helicase family protein [Motiliproteus sp.]MCW9052636.1 DEAD/DEAH box helicase family protein [Motiliproteus sp.]
MKLRDWQNACVASAMEFYSRKRHFLCLATPGAGKTTMAAELAARLIESDRIDFVLCFAPSVAVTTGLENTFQLRLNKRFDGRIGAVGGAYTYQSMRTLGGDFWSLFETHRVLVVFDEIHHCAGSDQGGVNAWGQEILVRIQHQAAFTLALTGTPWRSDRRPIVLAEYSDPAGDIQCDYVYGLREAVRDGVCREPSITLIDNDCLTLKQDQEESLYSDLHELFTNSDVRYQQLLHNSDALRFCLSLACTQLDSLRTTNPEAGGLVVASSIAHAEKIAALLRNGFGKSASIVTYKHKNAGVIIDQFRHSFEEWIVSVGMISEGTDIPRLQVCCHLSRITTELYFRQVLGRILRTTEKCGADAWLYTFAEPQLVQFANRVAEEIPSGSALRFEALPEKEHQSPRGLATPDDDVFELEWGVQADYESFLESVSLLSDNALYSSSNYGLLGCLGEFRQRLIGIFEKDVGAALAHDSECCERRAIEGLVL